jgi:hypothetical protein
MPGRANTFATAAALSLLAMAGPAARGAEAEAAGLAGETRAMAFAPPFADAERIRRHLAGAGYRPEGPLRRRGDHVLTEALRQGGRWRLVIDARTGDIVGVRLIGPTVDPARAE